MSGGAAPAAAPAPAGGGGNATGGNASIGNISNDNSSSASNTNNITINTGGGGADPGRNFDGKIDSKFLVGYYESDEPCMCFGEFEVGCRVSPP